MLVLNPRHIGSSGNLLHAASAQKPVLASDYGLLGQLVRTHHLGLTVDSTSPYAIAQGLTRFIEEDSNDLFDKDQAYQFALENSADRYAQTLIDNLL